MRRDIRNWSELGDVASEIEEADEVVFHLAGFEITAVIQEVGAEVETAP